MNTSVLCFVFAEFPHTHPHWSLAVMAANEKDAREYVRATHHGGKLMAKLTPGSIVNASCGATTEAAQAIYRERYIADLQEQAEG